MLEEDNIMRTNFCSECGAKVKDEDRFCPECGYEISEDNYSVPEEVVIKTPEFEEREYYIPPTEDSQDDDEIKEDLIEESEENYYNVAPSFSHRVEEENNKEFDPFNQNADVKTTIYGDHTRKSRNILFMILVLFLVIVVITSLVFLFRK